MKKILAALALATLVIVTGAWTVSHRRMLSGGHGTSYDVVSTSNATATAVTYVNMPENSSAHIRARVTARTGSASKGWDVDCVAKRGTGAITIIAGNTISVTGDVAALTWSVTVDAVDDNLRLAVTGALFTNINWAGELDAFFVID